MIKLYVIKSIKDDYRYIGITKNVRDRLKRHNTGRNRSTKSHKPFKLIYSENYKNYQEAREREKFLKSGQGRTFLNKLMK